jgi:hypothetical protein
VPHRTPRRAIRTWPPCANCPSCYLVAPFRYCRNTQISDTFRAIPPRHEGRYGQSSRNVRRGCDGRGGAQDVARVTRSTKPCGPDTPMLVSSLGAQEPGATVTKTPGTPRRARNKSSNIARGMPDVFGCTCDQLVCVFPAILAHETAGATAPGIPCALFVSRGPSHWQYLGANASRDRGGVFTMLWGGDIWPASS